MNDLIRLADNYNDNQKLKNLNFQSPDRWDAALAHISEEMQSPSTLSHLWQPNLVNRKTDTKMKNIAATVRTAVRTRPGTDFYKYLIEKIAQEK